MLEQKKDNSNKSKFYLLDSSQILSFLFISFVQRALSIRIFFDVDIFETLASRQKIKRTLDPRRKKFSYKQEAEKVLTGVLER